MTFGGVAVYVSPRRHRGDQRNHLEISWEKSANGALLGNNAFLSLQLN